MKVSARHHSRTVADGRCFLLQHADMNSGVLSPLGPERASSSACVWRKKDGRLERGTCVFLVIVLLFAVVSLWPQWEAKCLLLLVISALAAVGIISRAYLSQPH